ncbi:MAG TPA: hypothetical protein VLT47_00500 [Anaeromyxobacteraceae bacterium]|nr:hypothetical protein [Anaeromyxobacteraceae bacterium]
MRRALLTVLLVGAAASLSACDRVPAGAVTECNVSLAPTVQTDVLFVIDDSDSMGEEQANLQANLGSFVSALKSSPVAQDFHVGVTTTSVANFTSTADLTGQAGALISNVPAGSPAVLDGASPSFVSDFRARVSVGTGGSGKEQPFRAMERALSNPLLSGANAGLLRPGARLAVVFLSDEDDCSDSFDPPRITDPATGNKQCHNDSGDGVDYKKDIIDPVSDYAAFLKGAVGGEVRDLVLAAIVGVDPDAKAPTCGFAASDPNSWCCGSPQDGVCAPGPASRSVTVTGGLSGATWCVGGAGNTCVSQCATAFDKADRFTSLLSNFPAERTLTAAICDASFADTLSQIGCMLTPQDIPLQQTPADGRLLVVTLQSGAATIPCKLELAGSGREADPDVGVVYTAPQGGQPAMLHFQNACQLTCGQKIDINLVCAG